MKTVIIGCGVISYTHLDVLKKLGRDVAAICDISRDAAEQQKAAFCPEAKIYEDYIEMLDKEQPDVVHVLTPHYLHADMVCEILGRNMNCLCEKPLYIKSEDYDRIKTALESSKGHLGVCFQHRYEGKNKYVKARIEQEGLEGAGVCLMWHKDKAYYDSGEWRGKVATEGGALLINQAIHFLDQVNWLCGVPEYITASLTNHTLSDVIETEETAEMFMETADHKYIQFYATNGAVANFNTQIHVKTPESMYEFNPHMLMKDNKWVELENDVVDVSARSYYGYGHYWLIKEYYECIEQDKDFPIGLNEGANAAEVVLAAYRSNGKKEKINIRG